MQRLTAEIWALKAQLSGLGRALATGSAPVAKAKVSLVPSPPTTPTNHAPHDHHMVTRPTATAAPEPEPEPEPEEGTRHVDWELKLAWASVRKRSELCLFKHNAIRR